jgi:hypothetical protein
MVSLSRCTVIGNGARKSGVNFTNFGTDWQEALGLFLKQRDDLYAGHTPRNGDEPTLGLAMDQFLSAKKLAEPAGEITRQTYAEYEEAGDSIAASIGAGRLLTDIAVSDLEKLRSNLGQGKRGRSWGNVSSRTSARTSPGCSSKSAMAQSLVVTSRLGKRRANQKPIWLWSDWFSPLRT